MSFSWTHKLSVGFLVRSKKPPKNTCYLVFDPEDFVDNIQVAIATFKWYEWKICSYANIISPFYRAIAKEHVHATSVIEIRSSSQTIGRKNQF